jgi:hypothetical protein
VDKVFNTGNSNFSESFLNNDVAGQGDSCTVDFSISSFID